MASLQSLDPYQRPPDSIRDIYKKYQKIKPKDLDNDPEIIDLERGLTEEQNGSVSVVQHVDREKLNAVFRSFEDPSSAIDYPYSPVLGYEHKNMPGLLVIPSLLPPEIQLILLSRLLHRDLSDPSHLTNIHTHYTIDYPLPGSSFFSISPKWLDPIATPLDPTVHRPLSVNPLLSRKMRWMTLGGQYDWTRKRYPDSVPPAFPTDIKQMLEGIFADTKAEAAIVNLYSPGDTLSLHRDVAEECGKGLISVSLGCDAVFVIGLESPQKEDDTQKNGSRDAKTGGGKTLTLRLRSGSAVYMSGDSRFAWHGVPQILPDTCPSYLQEWPAGDSGEKYGDWRGWMSSKRVNLNVRQMWEQGR